MVLLSTGAQYTEVSASPLDDSYQYFLKYGRETTFVPISQTDGEICFGTAAGSASSSDTIRYSTVGWQVCVVDGGGNILQRINYKKGGSYLTKRAPTSEVDHVKYNLYTIRLSTILGHLNSSAKRSVENGSAAIKLNACMTVVRNNVPSGSMDDSGRISGLVYTDYVSLCNAVDWSEGTKNFFKTYYGKQVKDLYRKLEVKCGTGIAGVYGGGNYIYGTAVRIQATPLKGYVFGYWVGSKSIYQQSADVVMSDNYVYTAYGTATYVTVTYYRNQTERDMVSTDRNLYYGKKGQTLLVPDWTNPGYSLSGWSEIRGGTVKYAVNQYVIDEFVWTKQPRLNLYAAWKPHEYTISFEAKEGDYLPESVRTNITQNVGMPAGVRNMATKNTVYSWNTAKDGSGLDIRAGEIISVRELADYTGKINTNGAEITLYAIWSEAPVIVAEDYYFSAEEASQGKITEELLAKYVSCTDRYDGSITYGENAANQFIMLDFDASRYLDVHENTDFEEIFYARNSLGNERRLEVTVHIVDTSIRWKEKNCRTRVRFIKKDYVMGEEGEALAEEEGGLRANSVWRQKDYWDLLLKTFKNGL